MQMICFSLHEQIVYAPANILMVKEEIMQDILFTVLSCSSLYISRDELLKLLV